MARFGRRLACCCMVPLIFILLIVGAVYSAYAFVPFGTTFGLADTDLGGFTMRDAGIENKTLRDFYKGKIKDLGTLGDIDLFESGITLNKLRLSNNSIKDIGTKEIKHLGFYDVPFSDILGDLLTQAKLADGGSGAPSGFDFADALGSLTFKNLKLGSERLLDLRLSSLFNLAKSFTNDDADPMDMLSAISPIFGKKIGQLGGGEFKDIDLLDFINVDIAALLGDDVPDDMIEFLEDIDLSGIFCIKALKFTDGLNISDMTLMDLISNINKLDIDTMIGDVGGQVVDQILVPEEQIEAEVIEPGFGRGEYNQEEEIEKAKDVLQNQDAGNGLPTKGDGEIDFLDIFENPVTFENKAQIILADTALTAIFNDAINVDGTQYEDLKKLNAEIRQVALLGKDINDGKYRAKVTFNIETALLTTVGIDLGSYGAFGAFLPARLSLTIILIVDAGADGVLTFETEKATIDNLTPAIANSLMAMANTGEQKGLAEYAGDLVGEMFCKFMNNLGFTGTYDKNTSAENRGNAGLDVARQISIITRTNADNAGGAGD